MCIYMSHRLKNGGKKTINGDVTRLVAIHNGAQRLYAVTSFREGKLQHDGEPALPLPDGYHCTCLDADV